MGCVFVKQPENLPNGLGHCLQKISIQSTGSLQLLLQQKVLRDNFKEFINLQWAPSPHGNSSYYRANARNIATSCLEFWIDVRDFCKIKRSPFRTYRACFIFEKYLMHGATKQVHRWKLSE